MRVGKIAHASVVVEAGDICCFMDPVLVDPFESGANTFDPPVEIDRDAVRARCNLVVISHGHMDHFSPRSLAVFDRAIPVLYPENDALIERALDRLGFANRTPITAGTKIEIEDLTLLPTISKAPFPEMGMIFKAHDRVFWNLVDTVVDERVIASVRVLIDPPDLLFAKYQPLIENELRENALGSGFPLERYGTLLQNASMIRPRYIAPGSCGYRYARDEWLNDRGFPVTERQFESDLKKIAPQLRVLHVPHGGAVEVGEEMTVEVDGLSFVKRLGPRRHSSFDWRPERGVPPLRDRNPRGHPVAQLREETTRFLDGPFLRELAVRDPLWLEKMARLGVVWRLEVVHPDGSSELRMLDLSKKSLAWEAASPDTFVKIHTSITASAVVGLLRGECNTYALGFNEMRVAHRLYDVHAAGASLAGGLDDEPLGKIIFEGADERYLERELREILEEDAPRQT